MLNPYESPEIFQAQLVDDQPTVAVESLQVTAIVTAVIALTVVAVLAFVLTKALEGVP